MDRGEAKTLVALIRVGLSRTDPTSFVSDAIVQFDQEPVDRAHRSARFHPSHPPKVPESNSDKSTSSSKSLRSQPSVALLVDSKVATSACIIFCVHAWTPATVNATLGVVFSFGYLHHRISTPTDCTIRGKICRIASSSSFSCLTHTKNESNKFHFDTFDHV